MKDKKLQIFVSSTFTDLKLERQAAVEAILSSGHIPAGMELFTAGDESQMTVIERWIDESDIYLLILGGRYGSIDSESGKSYTHLEYEYALAQKKPLFAVVISETALNLKVKNEGITVIEQKNQKELGEFRLEVLKSLVKFWDDSKDIKIAIHETLSEFSYRKDLVGWIKGDNSVNTGFLAEEIARLTKENSELRIELIASDNSSKSTYSTLSFEELKTLLEKENVEYDDIKCNLYDLMLMLSDTLALGHKPGGYLGARPYLKRLELYKLVTNQSTTIGSSIGYIFTEDGHNFFLKALSKTK